MSEDAERRMREVDTFLAETSWDRTWGRMAELIEDVVQSRGAIRAVPEVSVTKAGAAASSTRAASAGNFVSGD